MNTSDFDYILPQELIAQTPIEPRDQSRLLILDRRNGVIAHRRFFDITEYLQPGDVLIFNDSRVIRARLFARKTDTGGEVEILLLRQLRPGVWETLVGSGKRVKPGTALELKDDTAADLKGHNKVIAEVIGSGDNGIKTIKFSDETALPRLGKVPLPPYIHTPLADPERYQTVYARENGSVAAPTAGLHFTPELLQKIKQKGVLCLFLTLHVGLNTFRPIRAEDPLKHTIYPEYGVISPDVAQEISRAKMENRRVICVGTTSVRLIESLAVNNRQIEPYNGWVNLFIYPGYEFKMMDALITNFHLPKSTLLMLVSAFAGKELVFQAYQEAISQKYRFYSFGDAMLIL